MAKSWFKYPPLPNNLKSPIRLVVLLPWTNHNKIRCILTVADLDESLQYEALSYVWGCQTDVREIELNGRPFRVTSNLAAALCSLSSKSLTGIRYFDDGEYKYNRKVLWIDALCIDQSNIPERNAQVQQMSRIYLSAKNVICWLGPNTNNSERALEIFESWNSDWCLSTYRPDISLPGLKLPAFIEEYFPQEVKRKYSTKESMDSYIIQKYREGASAYILGFLSKGSQYRWSIWDSSIARRWNKEDLETITQFFKREWFSRIWIVPEVTLPKSSSVLVRIGDFQAQWPTLIGNFATQLRHNPPRAPRAHEKKPGVDKSTLGVDESETTLLSARLRLFQTVRNAQLLNIFQVAKPPSLKLTHELSCSRHATDDRDKIFALLDLFSPGHPCFDIIKADYNLSTAEVYTSFSRSYIKINENLDILGLAGLVKGSNTDNLLSSWVADWRFCKEPRPLPLADPSPPSYFTVDETDSEDHDILRGFFSDEYDQDDSRMGRVDTSDSNGTSAALETPCFAAGVHSSASFTFQWSKKLCALGVNGFYFDTIFEFGEIFERTTNIAKHREIVQSSKLICARSSNVEPNSRSFWATILADQVLQKGERAWQRLGDAIQGVCTIPPATAEEEGRLLHYLAGELYGLGAKHCTYRRFFATSQGFIGIGPAQIVKGDVVAVVLGGKVPLVLRQSGDCFVLVGECYLHGVMYGEIVQQQYAALYKPQRFWIV